MKIEIWHKVIAEIIYFLQETESDQISFIKYQRMNICNPFNYDVNIYHVTKTKTT